jgi:hypothetical protein
MNYKSTIPNATKHIRLNSNVYVARLEPDVTWTIGVDVDVDHEVEVECEDLVVDVNVDVDVVSRSQSAEVLLLKA